jgi:hypothetical protein
MGDFRQLEGIMASLRALHIKDRRVMAEKLSKIYEFLTGESRDVPDISDPKDFARQFIFTLPPIIIHDARELKTLNENLLRLIESA